MRLISESKCEYVFTNPRDPAKPLGSWVLEEQMARVRQQIKTRPDSGLHPPRHYAEFRTMPNVSAMTAA
jgi:hypothetical protein